MDLLRKLSIGLAIASFVLVAGCAKPVEEKSAEPVKTPEMTEFERELLSFKTAEFDYIYVLKRKDGKPLTAEDKSFIRDNRHHATNRSTLSEDEKTVIVGSNFEFEPEALENLKERFEFEDFSKPADLIDKEKREAEGNKSGSNSVNKEK